MKKEADKVLSKKELEQQKIDFTLEDSVREGGLASVWTGLGQSYFSPYLLALGATSADVGIFHSLINFLPSLAQIKFSRLIEKFSRKKIVIWSIFFQILFMLPIILFGGLYLFGIFPNIWLLISLLSLFYIFGALAHPAWFSWMGSLVPENHRGNYFARRNKVSAFLGMLTLVVGAFLLDYFKQSGWVVEGFVLLFSVAIIFRLFSLKILYREYEPKLKVKEKDYFSLWQFIKGSRKTPFGRFTLYSFVLRIAIGIASPFWVVYLLNELGLTYFNYILVLVAGTFFQIMFYRFMGKMSDRFGNVAIMRVSGVALALVPLMWLFSSNLVYLIFVPHIFSGFGWAGMNLASNNYIYDSLDKKKTSFGITYYSFFAGLGLALGAMIGSWLVTWNISFMNIFLFVFLVSGISRLVVIGLLGGMLREVRHVKSFSYVYLVREFHPVKGVIREIHDLGEVGNRVVRRR
jgi:MFS family permease